MSVTPLLTWAFRLSCLLIALTTLRVFLAPLELVMPAMAPYLPELRPAVLAHIIFAPLALALGPLQFVSGLRRRWPRVHRAIGYVYATSILIAALGSLSLMPAFGGTLWAAVGFGLLALAWIATTALAVTRARARDFAAHRAWMIRSMALTFAAVTLRLYMAPMMAGGMEPLETYDITAWASWVPNLLIVEWWLRRRNAAGGRLRPGMVA